MPSPDESQGVPDIETLMKDDALIDEAIEQAVRDARREHKLLGNSVAEWRDGRVVWIPPEEIQVDA